jgi:hypothetical protein
VFTARYGLIPYIKQIALFFKRLKNMKRGFTQSLRVATSGPKTQLILNATSFFTVKVRLCWIAFSLVKTIGRNLDGSGRGVKEVLHP